MKKLIGLVLVIFGGYLVFLEISMVISETALFADMSNQILFMACFLLGLSLIFGGYKLVKK